LEQSKRRGYTEWLDPVIYFAFSDRCSTLITFIQVSTPVMYLIALSQHENGVTLCDTTASPGSVKQIIFSASSRSLPISRIIVCFEPIILILRMIWFHSFRASHLVQYCNFRGY
jgi:hypothetical protein